MQVTDVRIPRSATFTRTSAVADSLGVDLAEDDIEDEEPTFPQDPGRDRERTSPRSLAALLAYSAALAGPSEEKSSARRLALRAPPSAELDGQDTEPMTIDSPLVPTAASNKTSRSSTTNQAPKDA